MVLILLVTRPKIAGAWGRGVKKGRKFAGVLYGWPQSNQSNQINCHNDIVRNIFTSVKQKIVLPSLHDGQ